MELCVWECAVINLSCTSEVSLELTPVVWEGPSVDDRAACVRDSEGGTVVSQHYQIRERIQPQGVVTLPVHGTDMEREGAEVSLREKRLHQVLRHVHRCIGELDIVATEFV